MMLFQTEDILDKAGERRQIPGSKTPNATVSGSVVALICSGCGKKLKVKAASQGKNVKCPHCQSVTRIPV